MSTSQNGWTALDAGSSLLRTWNIPTHDGPTLLRLRQGSAGFLLCHLALRFDKKIEGLREPVLDDWGYAYRAVRGYATDLSNHSSGTAEDLNATDHPLGREDTFTAAEENTVEHLLRLYEGCIRWGGNYRGRKDEMHFELDRDLAACERVARRLLDTAAGKRILQVNPGQRAVILS